MSLLIKTVTESGSDLDAVKTLFTAYNDFLDIDLDFQNFAEELASLPGKYHPNKNGQLYLACWNDEPVGCAAFYQFEEKTCELKRLYVSPNVQGKGIGKALMQQAITDATAMGYQRLLLDSLKRLKSARKLYEAFGFNDIDPYNVNPHDDVYYMALDLIKNKATV